MAANPGSSSTINEYSNIRSPSKAHHHAEEIENVLMPSQSHFEKPYLATEQAVAGSCASPPPTPAPIALGGFLLSNTPATIDLMGWSGAGAGMGSTSAGIGSYYLLGAVLLYFGGIGEWLLGNTFPAVVFFTLGSFWATFGATLTPFFNALNAYADDIAGFYNPFAMLLVCMALLCLVVILVCFTVAFLCLAASHFYAARGALALSTSCRVVGAAFAFAASLVAWYLWFSMILEAVDFPLVLLVDDLSEFIKGRSERIKSRCEMASSRTRAKGQRLVA